MKSNIKKIFFLLVTVALSTAISTITTQVKAATLDTNSIQVQYQAQVQTLNWQNPVIYPAEAGTEGKSLRVEALKINLLNAPKGASIKYQTYVQSIAWQAPVVDGAIAGTVGKSLRVESFKVSLENLPGYSIEYRAYVQKNGWTDWVSDGQSAGTQGQGLRIEAVEIKIVKVSENTIVGVQYQGHVQSIGTQAAVENGQIAGTEGQSLRIEALKVALLNAPAGAKINYQAQVQSIGWQNFVTDNQEVGTEAKSLRVETLKIALENLPGYSVQYRVQVQHLGWMPWVSDGNIAGTIGQSLRLEGIEIRIVKTTDGSTPTPIQFVTKGYVNNQELQTDLKVRSTADLSGAILGYLYNYNKIDILDTTTNSSGVWDKISYNNGFAYVSNAYIQPYTTPPDNVVTIAANITKRFEATTPNQIAGNFDGQGLSLGYLQWCIGQGTLQPILNRMDRQHNDEMKTIFNTNYASIHNMILDTSIESQLKWAISINDSTNQVNGSWSSQFDTLCKNPDFINIETDAQVYTVKQAMLICDKYNLKTVRGFALAFDISTQNGSISSTASSTIDAALAQTPNMSEKSLLGVIATAEANSIPNKTTDILSREMAIATGKGTVHGSTYDLDATYGLSDASWR